MSKDAESLTEIEKEINADQGKCSVLVAWDEDNSMWRVVRCNANGQLKITSS